MSNEHQDRFRTRAASRAYRDGLKAIDWSIKAPERQKKAPPPPKRGDFSAPMVAGDYAAYDCPVTGKPIEGRAAHRENLKKTGCRLLEKGESREAPKRYEERKSESIDKILSE